VGCRIPEEILLDDKQVRITANPHGGVLLDSIRNRLHGSRISAGVRSGSGSGAAGAGDQKKSASRFFHRDSMPRIVSFAKARELLVRVKKSGRRIVLATSSSDVQEDRGHGGPGRGRGNERGCAGRGQAGDSGDRG